MTSAGERRLRILARLDKGSTGDVEPPRLCEVAAEVTGMSGAGMMLMSNDLPLGSACTSDSLSALMEDLQFDLGEGPCVDAYHLEGAVLEPDLALPATSRWLAFTGPAVEAGARAVFSFPLQLGAVRLGAMHVYRDEPGPLTDGQHADALVFADVATQALLMLQANAPPGQLAPALEASSDLQPVVHQAAGMISVQLDVPVCQALIRLRAHAFGNDRHLGQVARDVVARRLRFDAGSGDASPTS